MVSDFHRNLLYGGIYLYPPSTKAPKGKFKVYSLAITEIAEKEIGKVLVANIVALGMIIELTGVVSKEAVESAILSRVPKGTEELNLKAFRSGASTIQGLK